MGFSFFLPFKEVSFKEEYNLSLIPSFVKRSPAIEIKGVFCELPKFWRKEPSLSSNLFVAKCQRSIRDALKSGQRSDLPAIAGDLQSTSVLTPTANSSWRGQLH